MRQFVYPTYVWSEGDEGEVMKDWTKQLVDDISELDNQCFNDMPLTIVIRTDQDDNGERYFDATVFTGLQIEQDGKNLVDVIGADSLSELFKELVKAWNKGNDSPGS